MKLKFRIMNEVIKRLESVLKERGDTKNAFAISVGINPSNFNRKMRDEIPFTSKDYAKISQATGISRAWLESGSGKMMDERKPYNLIDRELLGELVSKAIDDALKSDNRALHLFNVGDNSQNITTGTDRAAEREEQSFKEKNAQLIQIINAKDEIIKTKDSEIRLLRKILSDNGIDV